MYKTSIFILFFLNCMTASLAAQSRFAYGFKASYSLNGIFKSDAINSNQTFKNIIRSGPSFTIGMSHSYFLNHRRTVSFNIGILYSKSNFTRLNVRGSTIGNQYKKREQYSMQSILIPLDFRLHYKKLSLAAGINYTTLLSVDMKSDNCNESGGNECNYTMDYQLNITINDSPSEAGFRGRIDQIEEFNNLQYSMGLFYQVNHKFQVGLEYRDFIFRNSINSYLQESFTSSLSITSYNYQTNSLDLSLRYVIN